MLLFRKGLFWYQPQDWALSLTILHFSWILIYLAWQTFLKLGCKLVYPLLFPEIVALNPTDLMILLLKTYLWKLLERDIIDIWEVDFLLEVLSDVIKLGTIGPTQGNTVTNQTSLSQIKMNQSHNTKTFVRFGALNKVINQGVKRPSEQAGERMNLVSDVALLRQCIYGV